MPSIATAEPIAPGHRRTPSESVAFGRAQWTLKWKRFASQWSQPQLMKLAEAVLGEKALHSSQIHGFTTGKLRDPAPKVLMAVGQLNKAIAFAQGADAPMGEFDGRCPETMSELWRGKAWMTAANGRVLGELECFAAFAGMLDLGVFGVARVGVLNDETMGEVSKQVGKVIRMRLMQQQVDFMDPTWLETVDLLPHDMVEKLIYGKKISAEQLETHLDALANLLEMDPVELWDEAVTPVMQQP